MEKNEWKNRICPYLGQKTDQETAISYPSPLNGCTHAHPMASIELGHQERYCLTSSFETCAEYSATPGTKLPEGLFYSSRSNDKLSRWGKWVVGGLFLGLFIALGWFVIKGGNFQFMSPPVSTTTMTPTGVVGDLENRTPVATIFPTLENTIPPTPPGTATTHPLLGLNTPLGLDGKFVIYQIQNGDSLGRIAGQYGTTLEAIQAINLRLGSPLLPGLKIVVPLNIIDVVGMPIFEIYSVSEEIRLVDLASRLSVDLEQFTYYNALDGNFIAQPGDYFLVPRTSLFTATP